MCFCDYSYASAFGSAQKNFLHDFPSAPSPSVTTTTYCGGRPVQRQVGRCVCVEGNPDVLSFIPSLRHCGFGFGLATRSALVQGVSLRYMFSFHKSILSDTSDFQTVENYGETIS